MADERALGTRARAAARRVTGRRRGGAVGAAVGAIRSVYGRVGARDEPERPEPSADAPERRAGDTPEPLAGDAPEPRPGDAPEPSAGDAELARLRAELNEELARMAARRH
jgi:hypothetical protein